MAKKGAEDRSSCNLLCSSQVHFHVQKGVLNLTYINCAQTKGKLFSEEKSRCCCQKEVVNVGPLHKRTGVRCSHYAPWS